MFVASERRLPWAAWVALCMATSTAGALAGEPSSASPAECHIHYRITSLHDSQPRALEVRLSFPAEGRTETFLRAEPAWAGVNDYAASYGGWSAAAEDEKVVQAELPNRWRVADGPAGRVQVRYTVRASTASTDDGKPQDQTEMYRVQVGQDWFQFVGHAALVSVENWDDRTRVGQCITFVQAADDAQAFSGLGEGRGKEVTMSWYGSPEILRHGFYAGGSAWRIQRRELASGKVNTATRGRFAMSDAVFADAVAGLVDKQRRFWGNEPESPQWVVLTPNS